jgi:hypothetical protein
MAYRNYNNTTTLAFGGLKSITKIDFVLKFIDGELKLVTNQRLSPDDYQALAKFRFEVYPPVDKGAARVLSFKRISECYNFLFNLIPPADKIEFRDDFRRFIFTNFDLIDIPQAVKDKINMMDFNVDRHLLAMQKLYKD